MSTTPTDSSDILIKFGNFGYKDVKYKDTSDELAAPLINQSFI